MTATTTQGPTNPAVANRLSDNDARSLGAILADLPAVERNAYLRSLSPQEAEVLLYDYRVWARPKQLPPSGDWFIWMLLSGRGSGKTWSGANWINWGAENEGIERTALVGRTAADVRDVMVEGPSGLIATAPPWNRPRYYQSKRRVEWPNGAMAFLYSADEPNLLRGPQHGRAWCDEVASWRYLDETWSNLLFGLRLGRNPQILISSTPRPIPFIKQLALEAKRGASTNASSTGTSNINNARVRMVTESTYANLENLAPNMRQQVLTQYEGTRLGRQELHGEILEDAPGALWHSYNIDATRWDPSSSLEPLPAFERVVVAVDPATTSRRSSNDTGIIVAARATINGRPHGFVLADYSVHGTPQEWATAADRAYTLHNADRTVGEVNNGGDLVEANIRTVNPNISYRSVRASRGKYVRAEPIAALYEQERIHHVGYFPQLEEQLCTWEPQSGTSPDRLDALVWAFTELLLDTQSSDISALEGLNIGSFVQPSQWLPVNGTRNTT